MLKAGNSLDVFDMWIKTEELAGRFVTLEPLAEHHIEPLQRAVADGEPDKLWFAHVPAADQMAGYVTQAIIASEWPAVKANLLSKLDR